ncbi:protein of unknown function [Bradyrhizobium vignae]|uniref:Uncharacterized protein n=1 Tax=Bradyrhizobium vignae TaxID=1549949 RepID=A0A2U3PT52_9BRAD|nr:protein of unknown function [Bradyrhizobium vignae]
MLMVISGIFFSLAAEHRPLTVAIKQDADARDKPAHDAACE